MSRCCFQYADLPAHLKAQVDAQRRSGLAKGAAPQPAGECRQAERAPRSRRAGRRAPNKTEGAYRAAILSRRTDVAAVYYEGITIRMANGHRYTPDWVVVTVASVIECHEVKGGYRFGSHQRARLAFDQARLEFAWIKFVWAEKTREGWR